MTDTIEIIEEIEIIENLANILYDKFDEWDNEYADLVEYDSSPISRYLKYEYPNMTTKEIYSYTMAFIMLCMYGNII